MNITKIWYEFDEWTQDYDEYDSNADVHFILNDGSSWCAEFFTYKNLVTLSEKNRKTGECLSGEYFLADKPIFISRMNKELILSVLTDIINSEDDLSAVFTVIK